MDEWNEDTAEHEPDEPDDLEDAVAELEALSMRRIALEAIDEMMD